ncbi:MAG: hypothetical protein R3F31_19385 [Verrucomicrobiales bacterium]
MHDILQIVQGDHSGDVEGTCHNGGVGRRTARFRRKAQNQITIEGCRVGRRQVMGQ